MTDQFLLGSSASADPASWSIVATLLSNGSGDITEGRALEWEFQPYAEYETLGNGQTMGQGYPVITWTFKALRPDQRENLRDFCTGMSTTVYIRTPTNETTAGAKIWDDFLCILHWTTRAELVGVNYIEQVVLTFTHCVAI